MTVAPVCSNGADGDMVIRQPLALHDRSSHALSCCLIGGVYQRDGKRRGDSAAHRGPSNGMNPSPERKKVAIITGASQGIGAGVAAGFRRGIYIESRSLATHSTTMPRSRR